MITYSKGYKYQLEEPYAVQTPVTGYNIETRYFALVPNGCMIVGVGYAWDGASGPTFDSKSSMTPSLVHDVFCQLMRNKQISYDLWQDTINAFFEKQCIDCGMWPIRAAIWHAGVEIGDAGNPKQGPDRPKFTAP